MHVKTLVCSRLALSRISKTVKFTCLEEVLSVLRWGLKWLFCGVLSSFGVTEFRKGKDDANKTLKKQFR